MSARRPPRSATEADTVVSAEPVHMRRWTARPRTIHAAARVWGRLSFLLRTGVSRAMVWLEAGENIVAGGLQARLVQAHARRMESRRGPMLRRLGEAVYTKDQAARQHLEAELR